MTASSPWYLLGAGSLGCLYAAYLRRAGCDVHLLLRDAASLAQFHRHGGLRLQRDDATDNIAIAAEIAGADGAAIERLLICTKAQQTLAAVDAIRPRLAPQPLLILLQNGMGVREALQHELPDADILSAISTEGAYQRERFAVVHAGHGNTVIGALDPQRPQIARAAAAALHCELSIDAIDDIAPRLWLKLAVNSVINPLTALHRCRNGELLELPDIDRSIDTLCAELAAVANAEGVALTAQQLCSAVHAVIRATARNRSSMLQDRLAQRPTEIDFINGFIVRCGQHHGIDCPQHAALYAAVKALES